MDPPPDSTQELLTLLIDRAQVLADLLYGTALDGGSADNFGRPANVPGNITERDPVLPDYNAGFLRFDQDFPGIGVKKDIGDTGGLRDDCPDLGCRLLRIFKDGRTDYDPLPEIPGKDPDQVGLIGKSFGIIGVDDQFRAFEFDLFYRNAGRYFLVDLVFELFEPFFN